MVSERTTAEGVAAETPRAIVGHTAYSCALLYPHALRDEADMSTCAVVWCDRASVARGLCKRCYARYKRGLDPNKTRQYTTRETKDRVRYEVTERREWGESIADIAASVDVNESTLGKWFCLFPLDWWGCEGQPVGQT